MSSKSSPDQTINNLEKYAKTLLAYTPRSFENTNIDLTDDECEARLEKLLKIALDTRDFEIKLYWTRTTYYWAFMTVLFGGYYWTSEHTELLAVLFSFFGILFAAGWHWATRGSKYWQENWENHVTVLEILSKIPIHSMTKVPEKRNRHNPLKAYPYSVSKINQLLSFVLLLGWLYVFGHSVFILCSRCVVAVLSPIIPVLLLYCLEDEIRSGVANYEQKSDNESSIADPEGLQFNISRLAEHWNQKSSQPSDDDNEC